MLILLIVLAVVVVLAAAMSFGAFGGYGEAPMVRRVIYRRRPARTVYTEHHVVEDAPVDRGYPV
jgi:hypothetical protein